ncbi:hypothetical protein FUAX_01400 [Fulvitalea axinellae]|uniref:YcxB family protein n=1 Tax=Fulvitalea axinellae TaxID=1182444 RepID=A0AAU9CD85_9BACT|nr:hypothetical protein FUAX_01400 [Fulvitalea axinellae]
MIVKTKKYALDKETFIKLGMVRTMKKQWWVALIYVALNLPAIFLPSWWWFIGSTILLVLYVLFWLIQFAGITQHEQGKMLFEKLSYEIDSRQVLIKLNTKQGMPMTWDQIKNASVEKNAFALWLSPVQLIYLPFKIFNSEAQIKFLEALLKRKGYLK